MSTLRSFVLLLASWIAVAELRAAEPTNLHLYLLVGQSNMAGRGVVEREDQKPHPRVLMLNREGAWVPAIDPLHFDKPSAGVGLGRTFGLVIADADPTITVGLIPCAAGGSSIDAWQPGAYHDQTKSHPWDDAIARAKIALKSGTLKGILWHQGESNANETDAPVYQAKLDDLVARFRKELAAPDVPFIVGGLGKFDDVPWSAPREQVDQALRGLPQRVPHTAFVAADGFKPKDDKVHFDAASLREFGRRYAAAYQKLAAANTAK
ncbi:MAG: sialate O-acetylesterase [Pirellula sp.]|nr:sialate O-acetylesterase [Pirellula sp.]